MDDMHDVAIFQADDGVRWVADCGDCDYVSEEFSSNAEAANAAWDHIIETATGD